MTRAPARKRRAAGALCLAGVAALAAGLLPWSDLGERLELKTHDFRFLVRGPRPSHTRIVLVTITDATFRAWQEEPVAFWNGHIARAIRVARGSGAALVALDVIPAVNADDYLDKIGVPRRDAYPDAALEREIDASEGRVILTYTIDPPVVPNARFRSMESLAGRFAFVDLPVAADGVIRQVWPYHPRDASAVGLAELLARHREGQVPGVVSTRPRITAIWLDVAGVSFPRIELQRLAAGALTAGERAAIRDSILLIGTADAASRDFHDLPGFRRAVSGGEVNASALMTIAENRGFRRESLYFEAALAGLLGAAMALAVAMLPFARGLVLSALALIVYAGVAQAFFVSEAHFLLPVAAPALGLALPWVVWHLARSVAEAKARLRVERVFGRYLAPGVRDYLLEVPAHQRLGGASVEATVLFFDIRDSTTYAQKTDAEMVVAELNTLFSELLPVVERHGGLVNRFLGDGFLALFGVPLPLTDHAGAAVAAAREILAATERVNGARLHAGKSLWRVGCGLHTGVVVVGSIGDAQRAEFTVIGDAVNLASRLEGMNKDLDSELVISAVTYNKAVVGGGARIAGLRGPLDVAVRGRTGTVTIYWRAAGTESSDAKEELDETPP